MRTRDEGPVAATLSVALTNSRALVRCPPHRILYALLPTGISSRRLTILSSVKMTNYNQAARCHSPEYGKLEGKYFCGLGD
jgi:hypothetical protein